MHADDIESVSIHPAIGVARVGNAEDGYFLAPEVIGATPKDPDGFRDEHGHMKRQVARFRVYATMTSGEVRELTADGGVHAPEGVLVEVVEVGEPLGTSRTSSIVVATNKSKPRPRKAVEKQ